MKKPDKLFVMCLIIILALFLVLVGLLAFKTAIYQPSVDTGVPFTDQPIYSPGPDATVGEAQTQITPETSPDYVREKDKYLFLAVGVDRSAGLADAILLASFDAASGAVSVMQIPRDTYIEIDGVGRKINSLLPDFGIEKMRDVIETTFCVNIDYTAVIDFSALEAIVDSVGGVEIDVPFDMIYSDPYQDLYIDIKAGLQILDGKNAVDFVRYRAEYAEGDLGRIDAQKQFMSSLFKKVINEISVSRMLILVRELLPMLETDIIVEDAAYFAGNFFAANDRRLVMLTAPGCQLYSESAGTWYYVISRSGCLEAVNGYFNVYGSPIREHLFDQDVILCKEEDDDFLRIYKYSLLPPKPVEG